MLHFNVQITDIVWNEIKPYIVRHLSAETGIHFPSTKWRRLMCASGQNSYIHWQMITNYIILFDFLASWFSVLQTVCYFGLTRFFEIIILQSCFWIMVKLNNEYVLCCLIFLWFREILYLTWFALVMNCPTWHHPTQSGLIAKLTKGTLNFL